MQLFLSIAQIATAIALSILILVQQRGTALGSAFGGDSGGGYATRRGFQKNKQISEPADPSSRRNVLRLFKWKIKLPKIKQWIRLPFILSTKEKLFFFSFSILFLCSFVFLSVNGYFKNTKINPARGGIYIEGVVGQPGFVNPI